jgi:hypothetical protein
MLEFLNRARIFRGGVRVGESVTNFSRPTYHPGSREWFYASVTSVDSGRSESLFTAPVSCAWLKGRGQRIGHLLRL